jgi:hypothetical protein
VFLFLLLAAGLPEEGLNIMGHFFLFLKAILEFRKKEGIVETKVDVHDY